MVLAAVLGSLVPGSARAIAPILVLNTNDSGPGSLRAAIELANATAGADTIAFAIPVTDPGFNGQWFTIKPLSNLPPLTDAATTIDGSTQVAFTGDTNPAGPEIELNGALVPAPSFGLVVESSDNTIHSLVANGFRRDGFEPCCHGGTAIDVRSGSGNSVTGSYVGIDPTGTLSVANDVVGISLGSGATGNTIGGPAAADRNVASGNGHYGILILAGGNRIEGNYVGTTAVGTEGHFGNGSAIPGGAGIHTGLSDGNTIVGNVVSGNGDESSDFGIFLGGSSNVVQRNLVGTDASGTAVVPNWRGIGIGGSGNTIGGTTAAVRNVISGNWAAGIDGGGTGNVVEGNYIGTDVTGQTGLMNGAVTLTGGIHLFAATDWVIRGNLVSGNKGPGIRLFGSPSAPSTRTVIGGNLIGTNAAGTAMLPNSDGPTPVGGNTQAGIDASRAVDTLIADNVISGNGNPGASDPGVRLGIDSTGTRLEGNAIGASADGTIAIPNGSGVSIFGSSDNEFVDNAVLDNRGAGIGIAGGDDNVIRGNRVERNGHTISFGCQFGCGGIVVGGFHPLGLLADRTVIGGTAPGEGNVISGNGNAGIEMRGQAGIGTTIQGNLIGTDASGNAANGNRLAGIAAQGTGTLIGGAASGARNVISGNGATGVVASGTGTVVEGNYIGTNLAGTAALPNGEDGVLVGFGGPAEVVANVISNNPRFGVLVRSGGSRVERNRIANNGSAGVAVSVFAGRGNTITRNSIFGNGELGIDLAPLGVNPNDPGDADGGANDGQNYPVLERAVAGGGRLVVIGSIDTPNPESVTIEFFANGVPSPGGDPSGHGEGAVFLGAATPNPTGRFTAVLPPVAAGTLITATATDAAGNTSEFAANAAAK